MQILLTQEEYAALQEQKQLREIVQAGKLQEICTLAAKHIPVPHDWSDDKTPRPWGCILDKETNPGYCDDCPVDEICPFPSKEWSK